MRAIETLVQEPVALAIGWALIHFVWQGALIGVLAAAALVALRRSAADVRYVVAAIALALMATMPLVTAVQTWRTVSPRTVPGSRAATATPDDALMRAVPAPAVASAMPSDGAPVSPVSWRIVRPAGIEPWLPVFVLAWLSGVVVLTLRLLGGWLWVQRMKSHGANAVARELQVIVERLSKQLHISRRVRLLQSSGVDVPTVIGWAKPVILMPVTALAGLSLSQVEAILAHELAHIRRHDYLVNLLQTLLETMLFYHPAVWWVSRRIRAEREHCCDDLAVSLCGDPVAYARALADLEGRRAAPVHLALAANGGALLQRVR
ncbi:MAG TPA: M56 family metallopeptidase, partial [Vicinamibacterales bacterium]|nr:M56 family metallopeptidase [Vicinamibacterales bacterium]